MSASRILKITNGGEVELFEPSAGGTSYIAVKAPALAASWTLTLPPDDGTADYILRTDGAGVSTWVNSLTALDIDALTTDGLTLLNQGQLHFREAVAGGVNEVILQAPAALAANLTFTLPTADGGADDVLVTDGAGNLSFKETIASLTITALTTAGATVTNGGAVAFKEPAAGGASAVSVTAPALAGDVDFVLPATNGALDSVLRSSGAGITSWVTTLTAFDVDALTSDGITILNQGELRLKEAVGGGANYVAHRAPAALAADLTYTWPTAIVAGNFLQTDVNGNLSWAASAATLQTAYDAGEDITMIADTIDIGQANDTTMLSLVKTGAGAGNPINIHNDGTGAAILIEQDGAANVIRSQQDGAAYGWYHTQNGAQAAIVVEQNGAAIAEYLTQATDNHVLSLNKTHGGAGGTLLYINNDGSGLDAYSEHGGWQISATGAFQVPGIAHPHSHETISTAGAITITAAQCFIFVDTNGGAASDQLDTITGGVDGQIIILRAEDTARTVIVRDNSASGGNIYNENSGNFDLDNSEDTAMYIYDGTAAKWLCLSLSSNGA
jgi:hypothetical protein